jgi:hypothetical protein
MKTVKTPIAEIMFNEKERLLHVDVLENAVMSLENAQEHYNSIKQLVGEKKYLALVNSSKFYTIEKEAWEYASTKEVAWNRVAVAHYQTLVSNKLTANFFKASCQSAIPFRIFETREEALEWLREYKSEL